jgi:AcrR family transcriptional regulator
MIPRMRARLDVDERREQLLRLGLELFGARNYDDISIDDIAEAAGISRSLLYHYFRNKRGFYVEIIRHAAAKLRERIEPNPELSPRERVRQGLSAYLNYVAGFAGAYATLLRSGVGWDPEVSEIVESTRSSIVAEILTALEDEVARNGMVRVAMRGWLGMVEFACLEWLERREVSKAELIRLLIDALETVLVSATGKPELLEWLRGEADLAG